MASPFAVTGRILRGLPYAHPYAMRAFACRPQQVFIFWAYFREFARTRAPDPPAQATETRQVHSAQVIGYKYLSTRQVREGYLLPVNFLHTVQKIDDFTCTAGEGSSESRRYRFPPPTGSLHPRFSPT